MREPLPKAVVVSSMEQVSLSLPTSGQAVASSVEGVKTKISDFNQRYYPDRNILVESTILNSDQQVVLLRLFDDLPAAMAYYQQFLSDIGMLAGVNDQGHAIFAISPDNYAQLFRNKDVDAYASFFTKNYLPGE